MSEKGCCGGSRQEGGLSKWGILGGVILVAILVAEVVLFVASFAKPAHSADFYTWTEDSGAVAFTDEPNQVPEKFKASAQEGSWADVQTKVDAKTSVVDPDVWSRPAAPLPPLVEEPNPNLTDECDQVPLITSRRVQVGDYNRELFFAFDSCGNPTGVSINPPRMNR